MSRRQGSRTSRIRRSKERQLPVPLQHSLTIARQTLAMNDVMANVMGGMTKAEARKIIEQLTGERPD